MKTVLFVILSVIVLLQITGTAQGLECIKCRDLAVDTSNVPSIIRGAVDTVLGLINQIPGLRQHNCAQGTGTDLETVTCPAPESGSTKVSKCVYYSGVIDVNYFFSTIQLQSKLRDCILAEPTEPNTCEEHTSIEEDRVVLSQVVSVLSSVSFLNFKGSRCLSSTGVGAGNSVVANFTLIMICLICTLGLLKTR